MTEITKDKIDLLSYNYSILKRLGCGDVDTFEQRLRSQKIQYFAQLFGVTYRYKYNLYLHGPYSTELAHDLYYIKSAGITPDVGKLMPEKLEQRFLDLKKFIKKSTKELELAATLHWLLKIVNLSEKDAKIKLNELKNNDKNQYNLALKAIKEYEQIKTNYSK